MLCFFSSTKVEHRIFDSFKKFLRSTYTRNCEKFKRPEPQAQKENVSREEYLKSLNDKIRRIKEIISRRKVEIAATRQYADVIPSDDVIISSDKKQNLSATFINEVASEIPRKKVTLDEQNASNSEVLESISKSE